MDRGVNPQGGYGVDRGRSIGAGAIVNWATDMAFPNKFNFVANGSV